MFWLYVATTLLVASTLVYLLWSHQKFSSFVASRTQSESNLSVILPELTMLGTKTGDLETKLIETRNEKSQAAAFQTRTMHGADAAGYHIRLYEFTEGTNLCLGAPVVIRWEATGIYEKMRIQLYNGLSYQIITDIAANNPAFMEKGNVYAYSWRVGEIFGASAPVSDGSYSIVISGLAPQGSFAGRVEGELEKPFTISDCRG